MGPGVGGEARHHLDTYSDQISFVSTSLSVFQLKCSESRPEIGCRGSAVRSVTLCLLWNTQSVLERADLTLIPFITVRVFSMISDSVPSRCVATEMCGLKFEFPKCPSDDIRAVSFACPIEPTDGHSHSEYVLCSVAIGPRTKAKGKRTSWRHSGREL